MSRQNPLFAPETGTPLAEKLRPKTLDDYVGQEHIIADGTPLALSIIRNEPFSMLLWGPPGCGKTTLALMLAEPFAAEFIRLSAVFSGVKDVRAAADRAAKNRALGKRTILFIDEIHRFNKAQQDAFLPYVEDGTIILVGATTENPAFHINNALLSRLHLFHLRPLDENALVQTLHKGLAVLGQKAYADQEVLAMIACHAAGDARRALCFLEEWLLLVTAGSAAQTALAQVLADQPKTMDKLGDVFYELLSAFHKSLRGSNADGAMYWFARMVDAGADPLVICRRMLCVASEDIGNADPNALALALNTYQSFERLGAPEGYLAIAQCINYLALVPKSNASYLAMEQAFSYVRNHPGHPVPLHLRNAPTRLHKTEGYSDGYRYAHDEPHGYAKGQGYLPVAMAGVRFYAPNRRGFEKKLADKLEMLRKWDQQAEDDYPVDED